MKRSHLRSSSYKTRSTELKNCDACNLQLTVRYQLYLKDCGKVSLKVCVTLYLLLIDITKEIFQ